MRLHAAPAMASETDEISLTPMLDVVFILLIFFIVTASFIRETGLTAQASASEPSTTDIPEAILVLIDASDDYWIERQRVQPNALRAHLLQLHARNPDFPVIVQAARESSAQALVTALEKARAANIDDVAVAEAPAESTPRGADE
jgi:biopolymer transport protein ExbD